MRGFACALAISLGLHAAAAAPASPPTRVVSLNLCTDELVLLLAAPSQIVSLTHLAHDLHEFPYWRSARRYRANDGSVVSIAGLRPDLVFTMGGLGRDRERLARRVGARVLALPFPMSLDDVEVSIDRVATALGREARGRTLIRRLRRLRATLPRSRPAGAFLSGGGLSLPDTSLGAQWMTLAGVRQIALPGARLSAERLLVEPPALILRSDYRAGQAARANGWPGFRLLARLPATRTLATDGRRWTCMGPSLLPEIARLRAELSR